MPIMRVGVQAAQGSTGQIVDDGVAAANITSLQNLSATDSVAYSTDYGATWTTVAAGGTAVPGPVTGTSFRMRRGTAGGYPIPVDINFTEQMPNVLWDPAASSLRLRDGTTLSAGGGSSAVMRNSNIWVYGHSFTTDPGSWCTAGNEFYKLAAAQLGATATTYGVASGRAVDTAQDVVAQATRTPKTGSAWVGTRRGVVIVDTQANDSYNPADFNANTPTVALTATNRLNFRDCMRTIFAVLSSASRVESSAFTGQTGTWVSGAGSAYSNAELQRTAVQGSTSTYAVTVPAAGYVWLLTYVVVADAGQGQFTVSEGGTTYLTHNASDFPCASIFSRRGGGGSQTVFPVMRKIVASPGVHNFVITKTDASATNIYIDAFFIPHATPCPIITFLDQLPIYDAAGSGMNGPTNYPITVSNKAQLDDDIRTVASEFSNVIVLADPDITENRSLGDKFHPGDYGMASRANAIITAVNALSGAQRQAFYTTP